MNSFLQIPKSILKSYVYNGSSIFISTITLKKKINISSESNGNRTQDFFLSYKSEVEVNVKRMPYTKTL